MDALRALGGTAACGSERLRIEFAKTGTPSVRLCLTGLSPTFPLDAWASQFARFGRCVSIQFNEAKGSALVDYSSVAEAVAANNGLQGQVVGGIQIGATFEPQGGAGPSSSQPGAVSGLPSHRFVGGPPGGGGGRHRSRSPPPRSQGERAGERRPGRRVGRALGVGGRLSRSRSRSRSRSPPQARDGRRKRSGWDQPAPVSQPPPPPVAHSPQASVHFQQPPPLSFPPQQQPAAALPAGWPPQMLAPQMGGVLGPPLHMPLPQVQGPLMGGMMVETQQMPHFQAPLLPPQHPLDHLPPQQPAPPSVNVSGPPWRGRILKSGASVCSVACVRGSPGPSLLPDLNCSARTDLSNLATHLRAVPFTVIELAPLSSADVQPLSEFVAYLRERERAGVAKVGETTLFLVPPSEWAGTVLHVAPTANLLGVITHSTLTVPAAAAPGLPDELARIVALATGRAG